VGLKAIIVDSAPFAIRILWVCFIVGPTFWLVLSALKHLGFDSTVIAYWVQAAGSVGAIVGVFIVANWQAKKQQQLDLQNELRRIQSMYAVVQSAAEHAKSMCDFVSQQPPEFAFRKFWSEGLSGAFEASLFALKSIPVHELGRAELVIQCMAIIGAMSKLQFILIQYMSTDSPEKLVQTYEQILTQVKITNYSWNKFSELTGSFKELQDYSI